MAVDDHGIEAIRKSAEEVIPGSKANYFIKVDALSTGTMATLLQQIVDAVDGLEGFTDDLEPLITATNTLLTSIAGYVDQLEGYTDGVEGLITTTNSTLSTISSLITTLNTYVDQLEGFTDGLEGLITSTNTKLDTVNTNLVLIQGYVDGLEALVTTTNTTLASIDGKITSATGTISSVAASTSSVTLLASNSSRKGFKLYNDSNSSCRVAFAATASTTSFTIFMGSNDFYESVLPNYTGIITGIWNTAIGSMRITEYT